MFLSFVFFVTGFRGLGFQGFRVLGFWVFVVLGSGLFGACTSSAWKGLALGAVPRV